MKNNTRNLKTGISLFLLAGILSVDSAIAQGKREGDNGGRQERVSRENPSREPGSTGPQRQITRPQPQPQSQPVRENRTVDFGDRVRTNDQRTIDARNFPDNRNDRVVRSNGNVIRDNRSEEIIRNNGNTNVIRGNSSGEIIRNNGSANLIRDNRSEEVVRDNGNTDNRNNRDRNFNLNNNNNRNSENFNNSNRGNNDRRDNDNYAERNRNRNYATLNRPGYRPVYGYNRNPRYNPYNPSWRYGYLPRRHSYFYSLPSSFISINFGGIGYHYWDGVFYRPYNNLFTVIAPPIGIYINALPLGYRRVIVRDYPYYYYNGTYYQQRGSQYFVVSPPLGAVVESLPEGYETVVIDGETYYTLDGAQYKPVIQQNGEIWYEVIKAN